MEILNKYPLAVWFTGLSASGKSTLSEGVYLSLKNKGVCNLVLLDGEFVREQLKNYNYDTNDRNAVGIMKSELALKYIKNGKNVLITGIAHNKKTRDEIRDMFPAYYEIYLKCSVDTCARRDFKGNYIKAFNGDYQNFIGVTEPYQESKPELIIDTESNTIDQCIDKIIDNIISKLKIKL